MSAPLVMVTGADQHQGLAVIRGLGLARIPVLAGASEPGAIGLHSRYATHRFQYASPFDDRERFLEDVLRAARKYRPALIIPAVESTLAVLNEHRDRVERIAALAAPPPETLNIALDKTRTLCLAERLGVPVPRWVQGESGDDLLFRAAALTAPLAIKPRGHTLHGPTANALGFKVRYARSHEELRALVATFPADAGQMLIQECVEGVGQCVAAVCRQGDPLVLFAYARDREYPLSGGVSVLRRSIPLPDRLRSWVTALLGASRWHGVAMVEFKYDPGEDRYWLMEINGRFQASTALSLDAGLNLPALVVGLYRGVPVTAPAEYRIGVRERWLQGDLLALHDRLRANGQPARPGYQAPSRFQATRNFLADFRPGMFYDEFRLADWRPGLQEARALLALCGRWLRAALGAARRRVAQGLGSPTTLSSERTHRSMRA